MLHIESPTMMLESPSLSPTRRASMPSLTRSSSLSTPDLRTRQPSRRLSSSMLQPPSPSPARKMWRKTSIQVVHTKRLAQAILQKKNMEDLLKNAGPRRILRKEPAKRSRAGSASHSDSQATTSTSKAGASSSSAAGSGGGSTDAEQKRNFQIIRYYKPLLSLGFVGSAADEVAVMQAPWVDILPHFPEPLFRKQYGT